MHCLISKVCLASKHYELNFVELIYLPMGTNAFFNIFPGPLYKATVSVLIKMILIYSKLQSADLNLEMLGWLTWSNRNLEDT